MGTNRILWKPLAALAALLAAFALIGSASSCAHSLGPGGPDTIRVTSSAFKNGDTLPAPYTCGGTGVSPPLAWSKTPAHTASLAVTCLDPDAPNGTFTHWLVYDIPPGVLSISSRSVPNGARQGVNDFGSIGYGAPCPPPGNPHHYVFTIYALDNMRDLKEGASRSDLFVAIQAHILAKGQIVGMYGRS